MKIARSLLLCAFCFVLLLRDSGNVEQAERAGDRDAEFVFEYKPFEEEATQLSLAFLKDHRKPTKRDISGRWTTGRGYVGMTYRFEQAATKVTGKAIGWSCTSSEAYTIEGNYDGEILEFTLKKNGRDEIKCKLRYTERNECPRFVSDDHTSDQIQTYYEAENSKAEID